MAMKLYDLDVSGNCYKVRLLGALLNIPLDLVAVDFVKGAHKRSPLIDLNAFGQLPILEDGELILRERHPGLPGAEVRRRVLVADRCGVVGARHAVADGCRERDCAWAE